MNTIAGTINDSDKTFPKLKIVSFYKSTELKKKKKKKKWE